MLTYVHENDINMWISQKVPDRTLYLFPGLISFWQTCEVSNSHLAFFKINWQVRNNFTTIIIIIIYY